MAKMIGHDRKNSNAYQLTFYITEEQARDLAKLRKQSRIATSEHMREAVDWLLKRYLK